MPGNDAGGWAARGSEAGKDTFLAAIHLSRMPMCLADPNQPDTPLVFVNGAFLRLTGYTEAEVLGRNCRFLQGPRTDPATVTRLRQAVLAREDTAAELVDYRKDGTAFWCALYVSPVFDASGALLYFFASQLDITQRRQAEDAAQHARRMEALGNMASGMAHEFNNLMTIVVGSAQQALGRAVDGRQTQQLRRVEWAGQQAGRLTQQLLSFARRQFHQPLVSDLNAVVQGMATALTQAAAPGVTLKLDLAPAALPVVIDVEQLRLALANLVRNASDAMPQGGQVTLRTDWQDGLGGPRVMIRVEDGGHGMSQIVVDRAAEPFFTTRQQAERVGLGLSMVAGFIQQSGGEMRIESTAGSGTRIILTLPAASAIAGGAAAADM